MINVLFWNINKRSNFEEVICDVLRNEEIDILMLVEGENVDDDLIEASSNLRGVVAVNQNEFSKKTPKFFTNNRGFTLEHYYTDPNTKRISFCFLTIPEKSPILICGLHLRSKLMRNTETQQAEASITSSLIAEVEDENQNTIVIGDFNVNPFESGMIHPMGFNATLSKEEAMTQRWFINRHYPHFYNPMWSFLGDWDLNSGEQRLAGGYYFRTTQDVTQTYWNILDSILIRPSLIDSVPSRHIRILEQSWQHQFVTNEDGTFYIDSVHYSDHLPVKFKIEL